MLSGLYRDRACDRDRFGQGKQRDGQCGGCEVAHGGKVECRHRQWREMVRQGADGRDPVCRCTECQGCQTADQHGPDHVWEARQVTFQADAGREGHETHSENMWIDHVAVGQQRLQGLKRTAATRDRQAKKVLDLAGSNQHGRTRGESDDDRVRDEIDQCTQSGEAHEQLDRADHQCQGQCQADIVGAARFCHHTQRGKQDDGCCRGGPGHQMPRGAEQGSDDRGYHAGIQSVFGRHTRDGCEGNTLWQDDDGAGQGSEQVIAQ